jgi:hypothetical protein
MLRSISTPLFALFAAGLSLSSATAATVINGTFDDNANLYTVWPGYNNGGAPDPINPANPTGWTITGGGGINPVFPDGANQSPFNDGANTGPFAFLQGATRIEQTIAGFSVGGSYALNLSFNSRNCCTTGQGPIADVYLNDVLLASSTSSFPAPGFVVPATIGNGGNWYNVSIPFTADATDIVLSIRSSLSAPGADVTLLVDNVSIVPEPTGVALLLCGMLPLALRRRR